MTIVGHGDLASVIKDRPDRTYFASGVSNSQETRESEYQREVDLLAVQDRSKRLVYFSSLSIFYAHTRYAQHKREMEDFVRWWFPHYTIIRMGNIDWGVNPNTIINYLRDRIQKGKPHIIQDVYRYVVGKEEFLYWIDLIPPWNCEMTIPGRRMKVSEIVEMIKKKAEEEDWKISLDALPIYIKDEEVTWRKSA